jgi:hypothetical protein
LRADRSVKAVANLKISVNVIARRAYLISTRAINAGDELFVRYEKDFAFIV